MTNNNSAKEIQSTLNNLEEFKKFLKIVAPYRYSARVILGQLTPQIESLRPQADKFIESCKQVDDFNNKFNSKAWLCYGKTSLTIVGECLSKSDDDEAEELLADYFCNTVANIINLSASPQSLLGSHAEMIHHAYKLTQEGDYLAAIPLLLMVIDGISNNVFVSGIFSDKSKSKAIAPNHDYIMAFEKVRRRLNRPRKNINTNKISLPFRHGIIHGKDTNYATKTNAGKCWNFLGATLDLLESINPQNNIRSHPQIGDNEQHASAEEYTLCELLELYDKFYEDIIKTNEASKEWLDKYFSLPEISDLNTINNIVDERQIEELDDDLVLHCVIRLFHYWQKERFDLLQGYIDRIAYLEYRVNEKKVSENQHEYIRTRYLRDFLGNYKLSNFKIIGQDGELKGSLRTITVQASIISTNGLNETITFRINMQDMNATRDLKIETNSTFKRNWKLVSSIFLISELPKWEEYIDFADQSLEKYLDNKNIS